MTADEIEEALREMEEQKVKKIFTADMTRRQLNERNRSRKSAKKFATLETWEPRSGRPFTNFLSFKKKEHLKDNNDLRANLATVRIERFEEIETSLLLRLIVFYFKQGEDGVGNNLLKYLECYSDALTTKVAHSGTDGVMKV